MPDWYRDHDLSPECYPESEYLAWAQDQGLYVDAAGNVDYGPPVVAAPFETGAPWRSAAEADWDGSRDG